MKAPLLLMTMVLWLAGPAHAEEAAPTGRDQARSRGGIAAEPATSDGTASAPVGARRAAKPPVLELLKGPVTVSGTDPLYVGPFSTAGARIVGLRLQASNSTGEYCTVTGGFQWRWAESDEFFTHTLNDRRVPPPPPGGNFAPPEAYVFFVLGEQHGEVPLFIFPQGLEARVYLRSGGECVVTVDSVQVWLQR